MRKISLLNENWYIITDTKKVLYNFVRKIFRSDVSYPVNKIRQMRSIDYCNVVYHDKLSHSNILPIIPKKSQDIFTFYKYFTDYQYFYLDKIVESINGKSFIGIYTGFRYHCSEFFKETSISHTITELIVPDINIDCEFLTKYVALEKLNVHGLYDYQFLKETKLKYLCIILTDLYCLVKYLPHTIESLTIFRGTNQQSLDGLNQFPHLKYLEMCLSHSIVSTTLNINTIHFIIRSDYSYKCKYNVNIPNVTNIIISTQHILNPQTLILTTSHAMTCQLINTKLLDLSLNLPKCSQIVYQNDDSQFDFDNNVWYNKN
jgi:hypothetical protein